VKPADMNEHGLPGDVTATAGGEPVRRVWCGGNPLAGVDEWSDLSGLPLATLTRVWMDVLLSGDAWVDSEGQRVDPSAVEVHLAASGDGPSG
jgi:hypothetical protein